MRGIPALWFGLILLSLLTALTFWIDKAAQPPAAKRDGSTRHDPDYIVRNFSALRTDGVGNKRYKLDGQEMRHFPDDDSTQLTMPQFSLYAVDKPNTNIEAKRGLISPNGENVYFMDNVKVVRAATSAKAEMTLITDYLHIVPDQDYVETDHAVTILQAPHTVIRGIGMQYDKKLGVLNLKRRVRVHYEKPNAAVAKALTIEQVLGKQERLDPSNSVVQPSMETIQPVQAVQQKEAQNLEKKSRAKKGIKDKKIKPASPKKVEKNNAAIKQKATVKNVKSDKTKQLPKPGESKHSPVKQATVEQDKPRIRRHYENQ